MVINFTDKLTHQIQARFHTLHFTEVMFQRIVFLMQHNTRRTPIVRHILSSVYLHNTTYCHSTQL